MTGTGPSRRGIIAGGGAVGLASMIPYARAAAQARVTAHVADFGAKGDGLTNDTRAIHAAAKAIERAGGGMLVFDPKTYIIGTQSRAPSVSGWAFEPAPVVDIRDCANKVTVRGNGAVLRCADGLRYGTFDPRTGTSTRNSLPFTDVNQLASPYRAAVWLQDNRGGVEITDLEIDGRIAKAIIGGPWGDTGWQINHCGLWLYNNRGAHLVRNVNAHHHGQDGLLLFTEIKNENDAAVPMRVEDFRAEFNGRQGLSLTGGKGVVLQRCVLSNTGRNGVVVSNPGAGLDIEAELSLIRDVTVNDCRFDNNYGQGFVADTGNSAGITFNRCIFVGATNYAVWPNKPRIRFVNCEFVGGLVKCYEDPRGTALATQFVGCRFTDDPARGASRRVYGSRIDLGGSGGGTLFDRCMFAYARGMQLPYTPQTVRYRDCRMIQRSRETAYPAGIFLGRNIITGPVRLGSSRYLGTLVVNGAAIPRN